MEEEFKTAESLQKWLVEDRQVPQVVAKDVASPLFDGGYVFPSSLLNITMEDLVSEGITGPNKNVLFNTLKEPGPIPQQQQQVS